MKRNKNLQKITGIWAKNAKNYQIEYKMKISKALYQQKQWNHLENIEKGYKKCKELLKQPYDNSRKVFLQHPKGNLNTSKIEVEELQKSRKNASNYKEK